MKVLDLNAVIGDTEAMLQRTLGKDIRMTAVFASSLNPVRADARKLQQVILSLAAHARQAMPAGGRFTIETKNIRIDPGEDAAARRGAYVLLTLSDTADGMNDAALERLFDPVVASQAVAPGMGLEMSRIPGILRQFDGHIQTESGQGAGTAFKIFLPRCDDAPLATERSQNSPTIPRGKETVLLVEDEDSVRSLVRILLQSHGYRVLEAVSGDEAIQVAENHTASIDLLITDVVLPRTNGKVMVERLLLSRPRMKVLLISGYSADRLAQLDCCHVNFAFLQKPFKCDALANVVRQLLDAPDQPPGSA